jgi:DNA-binding Lrp family transcriptional regulator
MQKPDWSKIRARLAGSLSDENRRILDLLVQDKTQPEIGKELGLHRSAVWRRIRKLYVHAGLE